MGDDQKWRFSKDRRAERESIKRWLAQHLLIDGEGEEWVLDPRGLIQKDTLTFTAKFF